MLRTHVLRHQLDRGRQHRGIVGEADQWQHIGNDVDRQHEIGERAEERGLHMRRRVAVERAIIGGEQILDERQHRRDPLGLDPELRPQRLLVARVLVARIGRVPLGRLFEPHRCPLARRLARSRWWAKTAAARPSP